MTYTTGTTAPQQPQQKERSTVIFTGVVTKDPEMFTTNNGNVGINIDFAVNRIGKETHWGRATVWGTDAYIANDFCTKGNMISGTAFLEVVPWESNGKSGVNYEYNVQTLFLSAKDILGIVDKKIEAALKPKEDDVVETTQEVEEPTQPTQPTPPQPTQEEPEIEGTTLNIDSSDLPF